MTLSYALITLCRNKLTPRTVNNVQGQTIDVPDIGEQIDIMQGRRNAGTMGNLDIPNTPVVIYVGTNDLGPCAAIRYRSRFRN